MKVSEGTVSTTVDMVLAETCLAYGLEAYAYR